MSDQEIKLYQAGTTPDEALDRYWRRWRTFAGRFGFPEPTVKEGPRRTFVASSCRTLTGAEMQVARKEFPEEEGLL